MAIGKITVRKIGVEIEITARVAMTYCGEQIFVQVEIEIFLLEMFVLARQKFPSACKLLLVN
jgi:hypothetical protein